MLKRRNGTPLHTREDFIQYAVDVIKANGGNICVNEYRVVRNKAFLRALHHARKAKVIRRRRNTPPEYAEYYLVEGA